MEEFYWALIHDKERERINSAKQDHLSDLSRTGERPRSVRGTARIVWNSRLARATLLASALAVSIGLVWLSHPG